jgi:hypothetical protein
MSEFIIIRIHNAMFIYKKIVSTRFRASSTLEQYFSFLPRVVRDIWGVNKKKGFQYAP